MKKGSLGQDGEGWTKVSHHKQNGKKVRWEVEDRVKGKKAREPTYIFITKFLDRMRAKDLYLLMKDFGDVDGVFIPHKRDRRGKKYDFMRFFDVDDARSLVLKLDKFFIERRKLFDNLPRFSRNSRG
ncbi:unnamed protein product [Lathyrus sativus]|nr:unnamed protein product [Lathyrus sativus]